MLINPLTSQESTVSRVGVNSVTIRIMTEREIADFAVEQGNMLQVLTLHCQTMKRQETRLRLATAFLFATFLATLVWIQFNRQTTDECSLPRSEALRTEDGLPKKHSVDLKPTKCMTGDYPQLLIQWVQTSDGLDDQNFILTNNSVLSVLTKGLYLINLRMSYRTVNQCQPGDKNILDVNVTQQHSSYKKELDVITGIESMSCTHYWLQSVTLNRVIMLEADTALRVRISSKTCKFVNWAKSHLDVTYL